MCNRFLFYFIYFFALLKKVLRQQLKALFSQTQKGRHYHREGSEGEGKSETALVGGEGKENGGEGEGVKRKKKEEAGERERQTTEQRWR